MKKIITKVIVIILLLIILRYVYHFIVMNHAYKAIEEFRSEENKYYAFSRIGLENRSFKEEMFVKDNIIKRITKIEDVDIYCEWKNFNTNEECFVDFKNKKFSKYNEVELRADFLSNIPNLILSLYHNNQFNISEFLKIRYIVPTKYEDKMCYKIVTNVETIMIDRDTYLPVYSSTQIINSDYSSNPKIENTYEFKVGEVTDEDVDLSDLEDLNEM